MNSYLKKLYITSIVLGFTFLCNAATTQELKKALTQAVEFSLNATFESIAPMSDDVTFNQVKVYSSMGKLRIETVVDQKARDQVILIPAPPAKKEYVWLVSNGKVLENIVIERHYPTNWSWWPIVYAMVNTSFIENARFTVQDSSYNTIPCYKITVSKGNHTALETLSPWLFKWRTVSNIFPSNPEIRYRNFTSEEFAKNKKKLQDNAFSAIELWIGKSAERPFIYGYRAWSQDGAIIASGNWGKISFPAQIDQKLFEVPPDAKVKIVESKVEYGNAYIDNFTAGNIEPPSALARIFTNIGHSISTFFYSIGLWLLHNGGWFFGILSGVIIVVILIMKLKSK